MMGLGRSATFLAKLFHQTSIPDGIGHCSCTSVSTGPFVSTFTLIFLDSCFALRVLKSLSFVLGIVFAIGPIIYRNIFFRAVFALVQMSISHLRMLVEPIQRFGFAALETLLHEFVIYLSLPDHLITKLEGNQLKGISSLNSSSAAGA